MSSPGGGPSLEAGRRLLQWLEANRKKVVLSLGGVYVLTAGVLALKALAGEQAVRVPPEDAVGPEPTRQELDEALQWQERQAREQMRREARWEQEERHEREVRQDKLQEGRRR